MTIHVEIHNDFTRFALAVYILRDEGNHNRSIYRPQGGDGLYDPWERIPTDDPTVRVEPSFYLPRMDDMGQALLAALQHHYQGSDDTRQLRQDYQDERKRVDKLTDSLTGILTNLTRNP